MALGTDDDDFDDLEYLVNTAAAHDDDDDAESMIFTSFLLQSHHRSSPLFRKRWDSDYLLGLARNEGSFIAEYRVDPRGFGILHELLHASISRDAKYSAMAMSKNGSSEITSASRLGAAL